MQSQVLVLSAPGPHLSRNLAVNACWDAGCVGEPSFCSEKNPLLFACTGLCCAALPPLHLSVDSILLEACFRCRPRLLAVLLLSTETTASSERDVPSAAPRRYKHQARIWAQGAAGEHRGSQGSRIYACAGRLRLPALLAPPRTESEQPASLCSASQPRRVCFSARVARSRRPHACRRPCLFLRRRLGRAGCCGYHPHHAWPAVNAQDVARRVRR